MKPYEAKDYLTGECNLLLLEKVTIEKALKRTNGNQKKACKLLEISEKGLNIKVKRHNIDYKNFRL